jgi:hypothetical protein
VGAFAALCVVLAVPARAATPSPDPPPNAVTPEPPPVTVTQPAPVRSATVSTPSSAPVIHRAAPVHRTRAQPVQKPAAKPKPEPAARKPIVQKQQVATPERAQPHDRNRVPLAALVVVDELNQGLLAFGGLLLLVTTLSGGMVLWAGRRVLREGIV